MVRFINLSRHFHYAELRNQSGSFKLQQIRSEGSIAVSFLQYLVQNRSFNAGHRVDLIPRNQSRAYSIVGTCVTIRLASADDSLTTTE